MNYISLFLASAIWGSTFLFLKLLVGILDPFEILAFRFLGASLFLGVILWFFGKNIFSHWKKGIFIGIVFFLIYFSQTFGIQFTTASNSGFITGMFIVFIPIFSKIIFGRAFSKLHFFCMFLTLTGLLVMTKGLEAVNIGDILTLLTAFFAGLHIVLGEKLMGNNYDPWILNFQQFLITGIISCIFVFFFSDFKGIGNILQFSWIAYLSIASILAYGLLFIAQKHVQSEHVGLILALEPVFAYFFAIIFLGETIDVLKCIGGALIILSLSFPYLHKQFLNKKMQE